MQHRKIQNLYYTGVMKIICALPLVALAFSLTPLSAANSCNHPYYPATVGAVWTYKITGTVNQQYSQKILSNSGSGFVVENRFQDISTKNTIRCNADGSLSQTQYSNVSGSNVNARVETISSSGVAFPAANRWVVGATWTYSYTIRMTTSAGGQNIVSQGTVTITNKILSSERLTVAAGTYNTLKMSNSIAMNMTANIGGQTVPIRNTTNSTSWIASGVGMVKSQSTVGSSTSSTELLSFAR